MMRNNNTSENRSEHRGGKFLPALCSVLGTLILISVILICIPVTVPKLMGYEIYDIVSGSMEPEIPVGSVVYVKEAAPEEVQEGDVIAFWRGAPSEGMEGNLQTAGQDDSMLSGDGSSSAAQEFDSGVLLQEEGAVVVHRVVINQIVEGWFETKGDANADVDMNRVPYDDLIGCVVYHIPFLGALMGLLSSTVGKMYMVCFAACGAMLNMLAGRMRERNRRDLKQELEKELKETKGAL